MKPKEKAKEIVDKFKNRSIELGHSYSQLLAEANALIAVDEILKAIPDSLLDVWQGETYLSINDDIDYWKKVKQEIENL